MKNQTTTTTTSEKLQKVLARAGIGSRRQMETWITEGRIKVNGKVADLGLRVIETDQISIGRRTISVAQTTKPKVRLLTYNKPEGEVCTRIDPDGRPTVFEQLPKLRTSRWISIGRLDINTTGLLLFTNDGDLANRMMHPSYEIEREYAVRIYGNVTDEMIKRLTKGVKLEDGIARFTSVKEAGGEGRNTWFHVILKEGRTREVRRLWESQDVTVSRLIRIRYGNIKLSARLRYGKCKELDRPEVNQFAALVGLEKKSLAMKWNIWIN